MKPHLELCMHINCVDRRERKRLTHMHGRWVMLPLPPPRLTDRASRYACIYAAAVHLHAARWLLLQSDPMPYPALCASPSLS